MTSVRCNKCDHRTWQEGDREYSPPGYGIYYCAMVAFPGGALTEAQAKGRDAPPADCWLRTVAPRDIESAEDLEERGHQVLRMLMHGKTAG